MKYKWGFVVAMLVQSVMLYLPGSAVQIPSQLNNLDKVIHFFLFGIPGLLAILGWNRKLPWVLLVAYVPVSELIQYWVIPYRSGDILDCLADFIGLAIAMIVMKINATIRATKDSNVTDANFN